MSNYGFATRRLGIKESTLISALRKVAKLKNISLAQAVNQAITEYCTKELIKNSDLDRIWEEL